MTSYRWIRHPGRWLVFVWLALIVSGAATTGVLRVSLPAPWIALVIYRVHLIAGAAMGMLTMVAIARRRPRRAATWIGAALAVGAIVTGWFSSRSFAPIAGAVHAFTAALAAVGVWVAGAALPRAGRPDQTFAVRPAWIRITAQLACGLVGAQVVVGALLRHQLIGLTWHLLVGGLAALALLTPSMAMLQVSDLPAGERRAARGAIAAVVVQVALGVAVWLMMLAQPPGAAVWLAATVAHVAVGTVTLIAAARLAFVASVASR